MAIISAIIAVILILILLVLFVPFHVSAHGGYRRHWNGFAEVDWLWGFLRVVKHFREGTLLVFLAGFHLFTVQPKQKEPKLMEKPEKKKPRQRNKRPFPFTVGETFSLARRAIRSLAPKGSVSGSFGTGDPAETGLAYGIMLSILEPLSLPVSVTPDFDRAMFALKGSIAVRVLGARLIAIFLGSYLTRKKRKVPGNV